MKTFIRGIMQFFTKTAIVVVSVPYSLVIAANIFYGWPSSNGEDDKYYKALHPQRVYNLNYAFMEQVALLKWAPLWLKWNWFYHNSDTEGKDHVYGRNQNGLDIWGPEPESLEGDEMKDIPVIVFVYGGAWGTGDKGMYGLLGQSLANALGCVVCVPNYSIFPKGTVPDMINDLEDTVQFIKSSDLIKSFNSDTDNIILIGHSAGAHLASQLVINLANGDTEQCNGEQECEISSKDSHEHKARERYSEEQNDESSTDRLNKNTNQLSKSETLSLNETQKLTSSSVDEPPSHRLLHSIRGVVGIGGPYHIMDHYHHESWRGVEDLSPMWKAMLGLENFDSFSPTLTVQKLDPAYATRLPPFLLIHGARDTTVPLSSSEKFTDSLSAVNVPVTLKVLVDGGHAELALDMMDSGRTYYDPMIGIIKDWLKSSHIHQISQL